MGEHLPFALEAAGIATGKTTSELYKMMDQGKLLSKDFLIPFGEAMSIVVRRNNALTKATEKLTSQQARMGNSFKIMIDDMFQKGGGIEFFAKLFKDIAATIKAITPSVTAISTVMFGFLGMVWDVGVALADVLDGVFTLIGQIFRLGNMSVGLDVLLGDFYSIKIAIYEVIQGMQVMAEMLRGERDFNLRSTVTTLNRLSPTGIVQNAIMEKLNGSGGVTIQGDMNISSNATDSEAVANDVMQRFTLEAGLFQ